MKTKQFSPIMKKQLYAIQEIKMPQSKFKQLLTFKEQQNTLNQIQQKKSNQIQAQDNSQQLKEKKSQNIIFDFNQIKANSMEQTFQVENQLLNIKQVLKPDLKQSNNRDSLEVYASIQPSALNYYFAAKINYRQKNKSSLRAKSQYKSTRNRLNSSKKFLSYKEKNQKDSLKQTSRSIESKTYIQKGEKKRVRLKAGSITNLQQSFEQIKYKKCIPLQQCKIEQEQLFMENTYRLRKDQMKIWEQNQKSQKQLKNIKVVINNNQKDKKIINQAYDYDGLLLPNQAQSLKPKKHFVQLQVAITNQQNVEALTNYHERHPRYGRTSTKIKQNKQLKQIDDQISPFTKSFQNVKWNTQIKTAPHSPRESDSQIKSKKKMKSKKDLQTKQKRLKTLLHTRSQSVMENNLLKQKLQKQRQKQDLIEQFEKIRHVQQSQSEKTNFQLGFSKYVKIKKFQQKQHKSKSYNSHTTKFIRFTNPFQEEDIKFKQPLKKGLQKIRANKKLFKKVFNVSMKYIQPELRQDPPTLKCIKDNLQNQQSQRNKKTPKQKQFSKLRHSQTRINRQISIQKLSKSPIQKSLNLQKDLIEQDQNQKENQISIQKQKQFKQNSLKISSFSKFNHNQTQKKLTRHGKHMLSRQSFNFVQKQSRFKNLIQQK